MLDHDADDVSPMDFLHRIESQLPCVIRNVISDQEIDYYLTKTKDQTSFDVTRMLYHEFLEAIQSHDDLLHPQQVNISRHESSPSASEWKYHGNGADTLYLALSGTRRFYLAPPNSLPVYPFSSTSWYNVKETHMIDLESGDLLYLPAFWFHKESTLADDTILHYSMFTKKNPSMASIRDQELFGLHTLFNTSMNSHIKDIYRTHEHRPHMIASIGRGIYEMIPFLAIFIIVYYLATTYKIPYLIPVLLVSGVVIGLYMYLNDDEEKKTNGMTRIVGFYVLVITSIFSIIEWNEHQDVFTTLFDKEVPLPVRAK